MMKKETVDAVKHYQDALRMQAEQLIINEFPTKIVALNDLLVKLDVNNRKLSDVHQDLKIPVTLAPSGDDEDVVAGRKRRRLDCVTASKSKEQPLALKDPVACNELLTSLISVIKPYIKKLVEDSNMLKMWISYMIPKIQNGNNFGVSIQMMILGEIKTAEMKGKDFLEQICEYYVARGKVVSKVLKYPYIHDYRRAVREMDEKQYLTLWLRVCEVRNQYCILHDMVIKNFDMIRKPRTFNPDLFY